MRPPRLINSGVSLKLRCAREPPLTLRSANVRHCGRVECGATLLSDHECATCSAAAADIQQREFLGALDLVAASLFGHLLVAVEHLAYARSANRMAAADKPAPGINR